jgi:hypothetical protein
MEQYEYFIRLYEQSVNNADFINFIENNSRINHLDEGILSGNKINNDIVIETNADEIKEKIKNNSLTTLRLGCVEASFFLMHKLNKSVPLDHIVYSGYSDEKMKRNTGLYYRNDIDRGRVSEWYCNHLLELANESTLTSCYSVIKYDLTLYAYLNIKGKTLHNWGLLPQILMTSLEGKKVLVISNATDILKKSADRDLQNVYNINISKFSSIYFLKTPQTTEGAEYPDDSIIETTDKLLKEIRNINFDIAFLACGAYGVALTNEIRKMGKMAVYLGSALYTMFGVYSDGIPLPTHNIYKTENFIEIEEKCPEHCKNIDEGKYWKV